MERMSANNEIVIKKKENGLYQVRHSFVDSLVHAMANVEPTEDELLIEILADDVKELQEAINIANKYMENEEVEYGLSITTNVAE